MGLSFSHSPHWEEGSVTDSTTAIDVLTTALQSKNEEVMKEALRSMSDDLDWCVCDHLTSLVHLLQLRINGVVNKPR